MTDTLHRLSEEPDTAGTGGDVRVCRQAVELTSIRSACLSIGRRMFGFGLDATALPLGVLHQQQEGVSDYSLHEDLKVHFPPPPYSHFSVRTV